MINVIYTPIWNPKARNFSWAKHVTSVDMSIHDADCFCGVSLQAGENSLPFGAVVVEKEPVQRNFPFCVWVWRLGLVHETGLLWFNDKAGEDGEPDWIPHRGEKWAEDKETPNSAGWGDLEFHAFRDRVQALLPPVVSGVLTHEDRKRAFAAGKELMNAKHLQLQKCFDMINTLLQEIPAN